MGILEDTYYAFMLTIRAFVAFINTDFQIPKVL